jgi:hypothetical protein
MVHSHYRPHLNSVLHQFNALKHSTSCFYTCHSDINIPYALRLPSGTFPSRRPPNILALRLLPPPYVLHNTPTDSIFGRNNFGETAQIMKLSSWFEQLLRNETRIRALLCNAPDQLLWYGCHSVHPFPALKYWGPEVTPLCPRPFRYQHSQSQISCLSDPRVAPVKPKRVAAIVTALPSVMHICV